MKGLKVLRFRRTADRMIQDCNVYSKWSALEKKLQPIQQNQPSTQRYIVEDPKNFIDKFKVTDTETNQVVNVQFAFVGKDMKHSATWDYAPIYEMMEIEGGEYDKFRIRMHQDQEFIEQQFIMNRRHDIWYQQTKGKGRIVSGLHCASAWLIDTDGQDFFLTSDITMPKDYIPSKLIFNLFMRFYPYEKVEQFLYKIHKFNMKYSKLNLDSSEIQLIKANKKSEELLKEWLSEDEYRWLKYQGELKIQYEDEIYIVKKSPTDRVDVISKTGKERYCMIAKDSHVAGGDILLSKIMMIKTNPKLFKKIAIRSRY